MESAGARDLLQLMLHTDAAKRISPGFATEMSRMNLQGLGLFDPGVESETSAAWKIAIASIH